MYIPPHFVLLTSNLYSERSLFLSPGVPLFVFKVYYTLLYWSYVFVWWTLSQQQCVAHSPELFPQYTEPNTGWPLLWILLHIISGTKNFEMDPQFWKVCAPLHEPWFKKKVRLLANHTSGGLHLGTPHGLLGCHQCLRSNILPLSSGQNYVPPKPW